jgi:hypothetical protein
VELQHAVDTLVHMAVHWHSPSLICHHSVFKILWSSSFFKLVNNNIIKKTEYLIAVLSEHMGSKIGPPTLEYMLISTFCTDTLDKRPAPEIAHGHASPHSDAGQPIRTPQLHPLVPSSIIPLNNASATGSILIIGVPI